ncbi:hypothetical protein [Paraburkholderia xenovorans]
MKQVHVQFLDESDSTIVAVFAGPQDSSVYPNQGTIDVSDSRYVAFFNSIPEIARQAMQLPD